MEGSWLDRHRNAVLIGFVVLIAVGAAIFYRQRPSQEPIEIVTPKTGVATTPTLMTEPTPSPTPAPVRVYITGAVVKSDVYILPRGSIIKDVIEAAGGFAPDAAREKINLAMELQDQQQIHVPRLSEENPPPPVQGGEANALTPPDSQSDGLRTPANELINLNTAGVDELDTLPGIGPAIANRIIEYRESVGGFSSVEQITQVSGIGEATFAKIKDQITVGQ